MSKSVRRTLPLAALMFAVLVAAIALAPTRTWEYDSAISQQVAHSMVTERSFRVYEDGYGINVPYSSYAIGVSLFMAVSEVLGPLLGRAPENLNTFISPVTLALIALVLWLSARRLGLTSRQAALASATVALGTSLLPYATTAFSEMGVGLGVAVGIWGILLVRERPIVGPLIAGAGTGLALLMRLDSLILIAPVIAVGVFVVTRRRLVAALLAACGVLPAVAVTIVYNVARFDSPLVTQYQGVSLAESFSTPFWTGLLGLIASPGRGIIFYAPLVVLMAIALPWSWRRSRVLTVVCLVLIVDRCLFYAGWWAWHGGAGWGSRYLVPAMPALLPFVVETVRRLPGLRTPVRAAAVTGFAVLALVSLGVQLVGATTSPNQDAQRTEIQRRENAVPRAPNASFIQHMSSSAVVAAATAPNLDWSLFPIREHASNLFAGRHLAGRYLDPTIHRYRLAAAAVLVLIGLAVAMMVDPARGTSRKNKETEPYAHRLDQRAPVAS